MCMLPGSIDSIRERYYRTCLLLLSAVGLWPFGNRTVRRITYIAASYALLVNTLFAQVNAFITIANTVDLFVKNISQILICVSVTVKYFSFYLIQNHVKRLIETSRLDWRGLHNQEELDIIEKYAIRGNVQTKIHSIRITILLVMIGLSTFFLLLSPFTSIFLDLIVPLNESRPYQFPFIFDTMLDQQEYFSFNAVMFASSAIVSGISLLGTDCMLFMFCQHASGLFAITSHRFVMAFAEVNLRHRKSEERTCRLIGGAIRMHIKAVRFVAVIFGINKFFRIIESVLSRFGENLSNAFGWSYFILLFLGISTLSISLYRLTQAILFFNDIIDVLTSVSFSLGMFEYMFFLNYVCQEMIDQSAGVFTAVCSTSWYEAPLSVQRLLVLVLLRNSEPEKVKILSFYYPSIEGFSSITQMSLSYFMVLLSIQ